MGRKKKIVEQTKQEASTTGIAYKGNVKIQLCKGKKVYKTINAHNKGQTELFRYIANCIAGNYNQALMPRYIHTFDSKKEGSVLWATNRSTCALNIPFSTVQVKKDENSNDGFVAEFTFMISYDQIRGDSDILCLYSIPEFGDNITPLAYIVLDEDTKIVLDQNNTSNIIITWQLVVSNQTI